MNAQTILILILVLLVFLSGIYINFLRNKKKVTAVYQSKEHTLLIFRVLTPVAIIISLIFYLNSFLTYTYNVSVFLLGVLLCLIGLSIRWRAVYVLHDAFRVKLAIIENHKLITQGLYKYVRHPSYSGYLLYYLGLGLAMNNYGSLFLLTLIPWVIVLMRIEKEEKMMKMFFPNSYPNYVIQTKKIIPFIY